MMDAKNSNNSAFEGRSIRVAPDEDSALSTSKGAGFYDGTVEQLVPEHILRGKKYNRSIAIIGFPKKIPERRESKEGFCRLVLRSVFDVDLQSMIEGYWVDVYFLGVRSEVPRKLSGLVDLDDDNLFVPLGQGMGYLTPRGIDPYLQASLPHQILGVSKIDPQPYGKRALRTSYEIRVRNRAGAEFRGFTIQDELAQVSIGSWIELEYHLVQFTTEKTRQHRGNALRIAPGRLPYSYEVSGNVCALWWPERGVFTGGDLAGRFFSICLDDRTIVILEDSLDSVRAIGGLSIGDHVHATGLLEFSVPPQKLANLHDTRTDLSRVSAKSGLE